MSEGEQIVFSNNEKIKMIDSLLKELNGNLQSSLSVDVSYEPIRNTDSDVVYSYTIPGSSINRRSQNSNLIGKLALIEKTVERNSKKEEAFKNRQESSSDQDHDLAPDDNFRYYKDNILCYRCQQPGHYKSVCPQTPSCLFCLSKSHLSEVCPQKNVCYRCYGFGHIIGECPMENPQSRCFRCDRNHAGECYFLTKGKERTKKMFKLDNLYNDKNIRCIRCKGLGHVDCANTVSNNYGQL